MEKVDLVYDPEIAEEYRREQLEKAHPGEHFINGRWVQGQVTAIRLETGEFYRDRRAGTIDWRSDMGEEISLLPCDWEKLAEEIPEMMEILGEA